MNNVQLQGMSNDNGRLIVSFSRPIGAYEAADFTLAGCQSWKVCNIRITSSDVWFHAELIKHTIFILGKT